MTPMYGGGMNVFLGDPSIGYNAIYQFLVDLRIQRQTEELVRKVQRGKYTDYGFGKPDKVLINISPDGYSWYKLEVPINKYINSSILKKNKYQYIKLSKDSFPLFSRFQYEKLSEKDVLPALTSIDAYNILYWGKNNIIDFTNYPITINDSGINKYIKIKGTRAYYLFDKNEAVFISKPTEENPEAGIYPTIREKGIINVDNEDYTVLMMSQDIDVETYIAKNNKDTIVIFKNDYSTVGEDNPFHKWGLEKQPKRKIIPDRSFNTLGEGSYGRGTEYLRESAHTYLNDNNKISPLYDMLNHKVKPTYRFNKVTIFNNGAPLDIEIPAEATKEQTIRGYPWSITEDQKRIVQNYILYGNVSESLKTQLEGLEEQKKRISEGQGEAEQKLQQLRAVDRGLMSSLNLEKLFIPDLEAVLAFLEPDTDDCEETSSCYQSQVSLKITKRKDEISIFYKPGNHYTFMDIKSSYFIPDSILDYGEIVIENDWIIDEPKNKLSDNDITTINNRITFLKTKTEAFQNRLEQAQKDTENFPNNISLEELKILSIPDIILYFEALGESDPVECKTKAGYTDENCRQSFTKRLIEDRQDEIRMLLEAVETNDRYTTGVLPIVQREIEVKSYNVLNIKETLNTDYYWISIDPEQYCTLSVNMTAKILAETKQYCVGNISNVAGIPVFPNDYKQICRAGPTQEIVGPDLQVRLDVADTRIKNLKKETEKARYYPGVNGWKEYTYYDKYFWINGGTTEIGFPLLDMLVKLEDKYEIPANAIAFEKVKVKDIIDINNLDTVKIRFGNIPRKVKEYDRWYKRYVPNYWGKLAGATPSIGEGGRPWPSFDCWECFDNNGAIIPLPDQYKIMNEMLFRAYFGSADGIENKNSLMSDTRESWEWIPYEYGGFIRDWE
jgi:hypothetical protein